MSGINGPKSLGQGDRRETSNTRRISQFQKRAG